MKIIQFNVNIANTYVSINVPEAVAKDALLAVIDENFNEMVRTRSTETVTTKIESNWQEF